jgi:Flp pilus assembly protein TadD
MSTRGYGSQELVQLAQRAQRARADGRLAEAIRAYRELAEATPDPAVWNALGLALAADGQLAAAIDAYEWALAAAPIAAVLVNLGNARRASADKAGALAAYHAAVALEPACAPAHFNMHAALYDEREPEAALAALERALALRPEHPDTLFYLGALRALHGQLEGSVEVLGALPDACAFLVASLGYVQARRTARTRLFADTFDTLAHAFACARGDGAVLELGVRRGTTARFLAARADVVHGFDAFEGLPEAWGPSAPGLYTTGGELPQVPANVVLHPGWFADTLPAFRAALTEPLRFVHVDCDLYASTAEALAALGPHVAPGTVLVFDEYLCNPGWEGEERRAFAEAVARRGWRYEYVAFSLFTKQAAVRLLEITPP